MSKADGLVPIEHIGVVHTKYSALLTPHPCYDGLRNSFFCPSSSEDHQVVLSKFADKIERQAEYGDAVALLIQVRELLINREAIKSPLASLP